MNSLREEIKNAIAPNIYWCDDETVDADYEKIINDILKLFEKRIDLTIEDIKSDMEFVSKQNLKDNHSGSVQLHHIYKLKEILK